MLLFAFLVLTSTAPVRAAPSLECPGSSQVEIKDCLAEAEKRVEGALATALRIAVDRATELDSVTGRKVAVPALKESQKTWSAYREAHCGFIGATFGGGSGTGIGIRDCRITLTRERIEALLSAAR